MNSLQRPARNRQIPRHCGARGKKQCIVLGPDIAYWDVSNEHPTLFKYPNYVSAGVTRRRTHADTRNKLDFSLAQEIDPTIHHSLVEFHVWNSVR